MSSYHNIVDEPAGWGLTFVTRGALEDEPYQYYEFAVLKDDEGYYLTTDSGCSCPSPFESHMSREDITGPLTAGQVREEVQSLWQNAYSAVAWADIEDDLKAVV